MKHLGLAVLAATAVVASAAACFSDPTSSLRNGASRIELSRSAVFIRVGDSLAVTGTVKDAQGNVYDVPDAQWATTDPAVAVVHASALAVPFNEYTQAFIAAIGAGKAYITLTSHGITDTVAAVGMPTAFTGAITAPAGSMLGDTITIAGTSAITFSSATTVTIGGMEAWIVSQTPSQMKVIAKVAQSPAAAVTFADLTLIGSVTLSSLASTTLLQVADAVRYNEPANDARATAPVIDLTGATAASPKYFYGAMDANGDSWDYWTFTLAAPAKVTATLAWFGDGSGADNDNPDFDVIICGPAPVASCGYADDLSGNAGAGTSQPESFTTGTLAAGQYYIRTFAYSTASNVVYRLALSLQ